MRTLMIARILRKAGLVLCLAGSMYCRNQNRYNNCPRLCRDSGQGYKVCRSIYIETRSRIDMSEKAVKARQSQLPSEFRQKLVLGGAEDDDDEVDGGGHTVYDTLGDWIQEEAAKAGSINKVDDLQVYVKAKELGIETKHKTVLVLVQTLFDENVITQIPKRAAMLKQVCLRICLAYEKQH